MKTLIAIDPGKSGAIAIEATTDSTFRRAIKMPDTPKDILDLIKTFPIGAVEVRCYIEEVSGFAGVGHPGSAMFTFGRGFGNLEGILTALGIPFVMVRPQTWQKALKVPKTERQRTPAGCSPEERKRLQTANAAAKRDHKSVMKKMAQRLYPDIDVTLANADALLLLEYAKKVENGSPAQPILIQSEPE